MMLRLWFLVSMGLALASEAGATFSVVAVEPESGRMGMAAASCTGRMGFADGMAGIWHAAPGKGVFAAQGFARMFPELRARGVELLANDTSPEEVVAILRKEHTAEMRSTQLGIVDLRGRHASYTGDAAFAYACDASRRSCADPRFAGQVGTRSYSVQGNMLTGAAVLEGMAAGIRGPGCDLPEVLMRSLERGARSEDGKVQGDARCSLFGSPGDAAFVRVTGPQGTPILDLRADVACSCQPACLMPPCKNPRSCSCPEADAVSRLRERFDAWRAQAPCPGSDSAP